MQRIAVGDRTVCFDRFEISSWRTRISLGQRGGRLPISEAKALVGGPPRIHSYMVFRAVYSLNQVKLSRNTESGGCLLDQRNKGFVRLRDGPPHRRCAAAHCWSHDFGRCVLLSSNIVSEISTRSIGILIAPSQF